MEASNPRRMEVMAAPRKYPDEVRDRAIRLVRDLVDSPDDAMTVTGACRRVGEQLGINTDTLRNWVKPRQYLAIRYTERLAEIGAIGSVGSVGDSYDNAAAESLIGRPPA